MIGKANHGCQSRGHGVIALRIAGDLDEVAAFVGKKEGLLSSSAGDELLDVTQLLWKEKREVMIEHFVFLVAKE